MPNNCEGRPFLIDREVAEAIASLAGPRRRDDRRVNQYGGKGTIKYNPTEAETRLGIAQQITLVDWSSENHLPCAVTVDVGRIAVGGGSFPARLDAAGNTLSYRAAAQVIAGSPAAMEDPFFIDVGRGQRFTTSASYVAVTAFMRPPRAAAVGGYPADVSGSLGVMGRLGYGTTPTIAPVVYTEFIDGLANGALVDVVIPPQANFLLPVRCSAVNNNITLRILDNVNNTIDTFTFTNGTMIEPAQLSEDAYRVEVVNDGPSNADFRLVFQISA